MVGNATGSGQWPGGAQAAVSFTMDNMGEAADINRKLWPESEPIGHHYTVTQTIPQMLSHLKKYDIFATYFIESWNIDIYGDFILDKIAAAGHEIGWHAWQHEAWAKLKSKEEERFNFERSFGPTGIKQLLEKGQDGYSGFRPPGGIINGDTTLNLCREFGVNYISPAGEQAASFNVGSDGDTLTVLPFKWATVDAYYYMETFAGLRKLKAEYPINPQSPKTLARRYCEEVDKCIESGGFISVLFHPFLTNTPERLEAMETVVAYLAEKRDSGAIWLARCKDIDSYIRGQPGIVGDDPKLDLSEWR